MTGDRRQHVARKDVERNDALQSGRARIIAGGDGDHEAGVRLHEQALPAEAQGMTKPASDAFDLCQGSVGKSASQSSGMCRTASEIV